MTVGFHFLTRATLRHDAALESLAPLLLPEDPGARVHAAHRLVWSLFSGDPDARREFLYRETGDGPRDRRFFILSAREPHDPHDLFRLETKHFVPDLAVGDRLAFSLRANPTISRGKPGSGRGKRRDAMADAIRAIPQDERAAMRREAIKKAGLSWLERQGQRSGFELVNSGGELRVDRDEWIRIGRRGKNAITFGTVDFDGLLTVTDPGLFVASLAAGFGRAKAFGCGLMLIRRA